MENGGWRIEDLAARGPQLEARDSWPAAQDLMSARHPRESGERSEGDRAKIE